METVQQFMMQMCLKSTEMLYYIIKECVVRVISSFCCQLFSVTCISVLLQEAHVMGFLCECNE